MEGAVLGELRVRDGEADRAPRGQRSRDLLAALLLRRGQAVEPAVLLEQVWGEGTGLGVAVVHTQVARLRRDVGGAAVRTTENGYLLPAFDLDADRFAALCSRAGGERPETAVGLLREALLLWRGDRPYADVREELVAAEASRLLALRTTARELLAERLLDGGERDAVEEAAVLAERLVADDPLRERGHELVILATARAGRRSEALAAYERLRVVLREELGIDPGLEAQELHLRVLRDELGREPTRRPAVDRRAAPAPVTPTIGREEDVARLLDLVEGRRLVSVVGLGGVGKSRVLSELGLALGARSAGYVDLAGLPEHPQEELVEAVAGALGVALSGDDPAEALAAALGERAAVLLLDEAERCVAEVADLAGRLLSQCPGLHLVVTSRIPLGLASETVHALGPLPTPPPHADSATAAASPAVVLLRDRIADRAPQLVQGEEALLRLAALARGVDGLPLAVELLAAQAPGRSLDELAELLDRTAAFGAADAGMPPRHRSLSETIGWSLDRLPAEERAALRRLSVFAGPFEPTAARAVVGSDVDAGAALRALVRDALVHVERTGLGLSYRLLRPVRDLAHALLVEAGELEATAARHARWHADRWRGQQRSDALLEEVREHYADYVVALARAHATRDRELVADLTATLGFLWIFDDMLAPGRRWSTRALETGLLGPLETARVLRLRGVLLSAFAPELARRDLTEAIPVLAAHEDLVGLSGAHYALGVERSYSGDDAAALEHTRLGVAAARHTHDERLADALASLAVVASVVDPEEAEAAAREAWALATRSGSVSALTGVATNLAWAQLAMGRGDAALDLVASAGERLAPAEPTDHLRFLHAWALLVVGRPRPAVAELARVVAAHEEAWEGRWMATCFVAGGVGLAALGHSVTPELLVGAEANWARARTAPAAWQEPLLRAAREQAAAIGPAPWGADTVPGRVLAGLLLSAAADEGLVPPGQVR